MRIKRTNRGFKKVDFKDSYGSKCSIQESSAIENSIWLGVDKDFEDRSCTRMHLTQKQARQLLPLLEYFVIYGVLPKK